MTPAEIIFKALLPNQTVTRHLDIGTRGPSQLAVKMSPAPFGNILSCEIDEATIVSCRKPCFYGDARELVTYLKPGLFDLITAFDLIEHLEKTDGEKLVGDIESLCHGRIIWATPVGNWCVFPGEKYHCHLSGWTPDEFKARGYSSLVFPKQINTVWFFTIKDFREPVRRPIIPLLQAPFDQWEWIQ